ncbi:FHA domain-containing protein [Tuwongella immobilis]|uniref:FHA domain-containing protein n=1 Tax=Tuwongella immobilis TaxID=692036 RepID=A0A6C2YSE7_9BACT|nr:FHA domain-containing protein [Tuwongella immobilis]VIP03895.1 forkhead-associated protein : FHA domain-containing protein OS=Singulisphaera acidiphila (strain ATCC BAA-1392 / DSM 18658 / VKM B-2454 / MOB10) GN=Sinac_3817 PE=4 SV=1: FHA [Tuwongella immobilis]VTS05157.1 forkhead-associated protein : FHA domain-containing protein OS=Singulisphaera acidiphila (strain ATCC BAA-1392 / DSM 18658 / VKM B-2454 / MOB10) GN=Sinac_3817 PE=4 SV=1: FHA [Tuwongella immobilis]
MASPPWLVLRQANEALKNARPEDAARLLQPLVQQGYRQAYAMQSQVMRAFVERALRSLRQDDIESAWADLIRAERIDRVDAVAVQLRETLTRLGLAQLRALLESGKALPAVECAVRLRDRGVRHPELHQHLEAAQEWVLANEIAERGDFLLAQQTSERIRKLLVCPFTGLNQWQAELSERMGRFRTAIDAMLEAVSQHDWSDVLKWAEQAIAAAPQNRDAQQMRDRAWDALKSAAPVTNPSRIAEWSSIAPGSGSGGDPLPFPVANLPPPPPPPNAPVRRFFLWIDGVAGFLVCLNPRITIGQAIGEAPVDIPLYADVSRMHASLTRDEEGYQLEASKSVLLNGRNTERALLQHGDRITLGNSCQLTFTRPLAISSTAKLTLVSGHRLPTSVDGIVLMSDSLLMGPETNTHVAIPGLKLPLILLRTRDGLAVKHAANYRIDGVICSDRTELTLPAHVYNEHFSLTLEPAPNRLAGT